MTLQRSLGVIPPEARIVSPRLAILLDDEQLVAFSASDAIYQCRRDDREGMRLAGAMFSGLGLANVTALARALGVSRETIHRNRRLYVAGGAEALLNAPRRPKTPHKLTGAVQLRAQQCLDEGWSVNRTAQEVDLTEGALRRAIRQRRLHRRFKARVGRPARDHMPVPETTSSPSQRAHEDQACEHGVAVKRTLDRVLASSGKLSEAAPEFDAAEAVPGAGVLLALPALLEQGLVEVGQEVFGALRNGFFGLRSVLLTFAFMALLRIKNPEQLTSHAPGELGQLLGLDRAPEVKTLRRKLDEMGQRRLARPLHQRLTERWAATEPDELGLLYLDGHVRPYHGRKHTLPKHHVQQRGRPMPGTQDFHVNDARAEPLFVVTAEATEGLLTMMEEHLLPEIRFLVGPERRVTVVFDREGWSPASFARWQEVGFDVLTYRKGRQSCWQRRFFSAVEGTADERQVVYQLAERRVKLSNGLPVREVRRLSDDGHQTAVITTDESLSTFEVAHRMFSRWRQENFFRYMRHEFDLDHLCTYDVEPADPARLVPHPERKKLDQQIKTAQSAMGQLVGRRGHLKPGDKLRVNGRMLDEDEVDERLRRREDEIRRLKERRDALPKKVPLDDVLDPEQIVQLERERKLLTDAFKMIAYRAESQLARWLEPLFKRYEDEGRKFLQSVFQATADLLPDRHHKTLTVRFHGLSSPRATRALSGLCDIVNTKQLCYPGTDLRLLFEAPECHTE
ncbi:MAG TPA: helix-turn-helix domain-containing protein [Alphaproteobacteria bacterium]|jgi:hypothetical protein|nr:helix-turn-helix domain-containing protein [Alphaproteobacteria bacterium]